MVNKVIILTMKPQRDVLRILEGQVYNTKKNEILVLDIQFFIKNIDCTDIW